ncbi:MAG TPA: TIGR02099 family protein, partial [Oxalobacteraceae bacterium]|nr:TIGR02099 family protein [Oxalobacteraceae bacterium]
MSTDQTDPAVRLSAYWRAVKAGYRYANSASYHLLGALLKLIVLVYFIFCALFLTLRYAVLPGIDRYKGEVEQVISRAIDHPVSIATIQASWQGLQPRLSLTDVVIHDKEGRQALRLPKVSATLSWWSVAVANLRLYSLEIDSPDVDIQRATDGNLYVAGILIDTHQSSNGKGADWVLSQREIVIHDGRVRWNDRQRGAPELVLNNVNFALFNHWSHHRFGLTATPPSALATPLDIRAAFDHPHFARKISDPALWKGELYVDLRDTDLVAWKTYVDYPIELQQGRGSVRAWLNFDHAKLAEFTADLTLSHVSTVLRKDLQPLNLVQVHGRVSVREDIDPKAADGAPFGDRGHAISLTDFSLLTEDGLSLPTTTMSESFVPRRGDRPA